MTVETSASDGHSTIRWPLLLAALTATVLIQACVPLVRVATSYKALAYGFPVDVIGVISAGFALLPILLTVRIGRLNDAGYDGPAMIVGTLMLLAAVLGLAVTAPTVVGLFVFTSVLGVGQMCVLSASQMLANRSAGAKGQDHVVGYVMVAISCGQVIGPLFLGIAPPSVDGPRANAVFYMAGIGLGLLLLCAGLLWALTTSTPRRARRGSAPLTDILKRNGLLAVIVASSICITASDLNLVYLPVVGLERGFDAATVGWLLSVRAAVAMTSRLFYSRLVRRVGHVRLMTASMLLAAASTCAIAVDTPLWLLSINMAVSGFSLGLALAASLSLTLNLAPFDAQATAISMRLTANRIGQFAIPLISGAAAGVIGAGGVFALTSGALLASGLVLRRRLRPTV